MHNTLLITFNVNKANSLLIDTALILSARGSNYSIILSAHSLNHGTKFARNLCTIHECVCSHMILKHMWCNVVLTCTLYVGAYPEVGTNWWYLLAMVALQYHDHDYIVSNAPQQAIAKQLQYSHMKNYRIPGNQHASGISNHVNLVLI